jgi:hypothetical protein
MSEETYCQKIADIICSVARREDAELAKILNKGIMHCPELAFVYSVAKELSWKSHYIFGQKIAWFTEYSETRTDIQKIDLYIKAMPQSSPEVNIAIEFKLGYEVSGWEKDVDKLLKIQNDNTLCMFCLLKPYKQVTKMPTKQSIEFFEVGSRKEYLTIIRKFDPFPTLIDGKEKYCIIGVWEVRK